MPPWVSVTVSAQGMEWSQGKEEGCLASHVESSVGPLWVQETIEAVEVGSDEQVGVDSMEHGMGIAGGTEASEEYDGKGKRAIEETGDILEGMDLRGKGSGPNVFWVESSKRRSFKTMGAHVGCL